MSSGSHKLSILIVAYNCAGVLPACLDSLRENPPSCEYEVVCAENGSTDGTGDLIRERYPWVRLHRSDRNLGFAGGNMLAAEHASGDLLLLLNPDTVVLPGALDSLVGSVLADASRHIAGACLMNGDGTFGTAWGDFPTVGWALANTAPWNRLGLKVRSRSRMGHSCDGINGVTSVGWVSGASLLIRRETWDAFGGMDTGYFLYYEETDLCFRVRAAGGDVVVVPDSHIVHLEGSIVGALSARQYVWSTESLIRFLRRNRGPASALVVSAWVVVVNVLLLVLSLPIGLLSRRIRSQRSRYAALVRVGLGVKAGPASATAP